MGLDWILVRWNSYNWNDGSIWKNLNMIRVLDDAKKLFLILVGMMVYAYVGKYPYFLEMHNRDKMPCYL